MRLDFLKLHIPASRFHNSFFHAGYLQSLSIFTFNSHVAWRLVFLKFHISASSFISAIFILSTNRSLT